MNIHWIPSQFLARTRAALGGRKPLVGLLAGALLCLASVGCNNMFRRMTIRTDPPGALVLVNGREVGFSPASMDFLYYGTYEITLIKDGYETETILQEVNPPWYQYPGIDFFADNLSPVKITNRQQFAYPLRPSDPNIPTEHLLDRANSLRSESQVGQ